MQYLFKLGIPNIAIILINIYMVHNQDIEDGMAWHWYDDPITVTIILLVVIIACGTVIFAMRRYGKNPSTVKKTPQKKVDLDLEYSNIPFKVSKSVQTTMASSAKDELRILDLRTRYFGRCNYDDSMKLMLKAKSLNKKERN